ncbi:hypothetical protein, partial [Escherichia coli]|uniref:hypothetical protein n=1 Tax=Escherichia coli TaxID=562 RepID=UPI003CCBAD55
RLRFSGPKTSIICSPMTSLKTSIKTITYLSDIGCLEIQGASLATLLNESLISGICSTSATHRLKSAASWGAPK